MLRPCEIQRAASVADASRPRVPLPLVMQEGVVRDRPPIDVKSTDGLIELRVDADAGEICLAALATQSPVLDAHVPLPAEVERTVAHLPL